jgi:hypothetical protein
LIYLCAALELREVSDRTCRDFASGVLEPARGAPVVEHWRRAISLGASLEGPSSEEHLLREDALEAHLERTAIVQQSS